MSDVLGTFEQAVLLAVRRLGEDAYGRAILKEVQARLQRNIVAGAIYATLDRLERKALLSSRLGLGTAARDGRARRYYSLEDAGLRALNESRAAAEKLWLGFKWPLEGGA